MIEGIPVIELTPWSVILFIVLAFMRGWIVPRQALKDQREDTAYWRSAHDALVTGQTELRGQVKELTTQGETTLALIQSITERPK